MADLFDAVSSPNGTRDLAFDLTKALEDSETLVSVTVTTPNPTVLEITNEAVSTEEITQDGITIAVGKAIVFSVKTLLGREIARVPIVFTFVGSGESADKYERGIPVTSYL